MLSSLPSQLATKPPSASLARHLGLLQQRSVSSSPYGRTHVWKRRKPVLPNPVVPKFPQRVIRSDGTSFVQWTTSPRSLIRLTRDTTNNPLWNTGVWTDERAIEEEGATTGRLGRFNRRFETLGGSVGSQSWMDEMVETKGDALQKAEKKTKSSGKK
ncbi:hypothetical protein AX16_007151 [Volvariella volvacea WC 439]|nr:hypothetical protein AX16_007151 [Volvariella volvacea WC 439]